MFAPTVALFVLVGQTPLEVMGGTDQAPRSTFPSAAFTGTDYVVVWPDDRLDALRARSMGAFTRTDLWQARVPADGGVVQSAPVCTTKPNGRAAVAANPQTGAVTIAWFAATATGTELRRALLRPSLGPVCQPGILPTAAVVSDLQATWTGSRTLLAWADETASNVVLSWLSPDGLPSGLPGRIAAGNPGAASLTVGALAGAARVAWIDTSGTARSQDVQEDQTTAIPSTERNVAIASGVALDQRGSVAVTQTGGAVVAHWADGGTRTLDTTLSGGRLSVVTTGSRWLAASGTSALVVISAFDRLGATVLETASGEGRVALATDGTDALLVTALLSSGELQTRHVPMSGTTLPPITRKPLLLAPVVLRRPSVAWTGEVWLIAFQEQAGSTFAARYLTVDPGGTAHSVVQPLSGREPVALTRPNGSLLLRVDGASVTTTSQATYEAALDTLVFGSTVMSSTVAPAGAATDLRATHWTQTTLYSQGNPAGAPFSGGVPFRSSAAAAGRLWIPFASGSALKTLWLTDANLDAPLAQVPAPQVQHTGTFNPEVAPALATSGDPDDPTVLIAWADGQGIQWETFHLDAGVVSQGVQPLTVPTLALAAAAAGNDFLLAWSDADGLAVKGVRQDGTSTAPSRFGAPGEQAGEPVAASSDAGAVAVVWPWYSPTRSTVGLRILVLDPFAAAPDAGVADAGIPDAGATDAGLPSKDGGVDAGETKDSGVTPKDAGATADAGLPVPDGGVGPAVFETSGCACSAMAANGAWALLLVLALRRRRRAPRG